MKILVIHGSTRKGNTYALTKEVANRLAAKPDVEITEIGVADLELPFCRSCHTCFAKGEEFCPHYDAVRGLRSALLDCDGVILSGTTYMWALNAAMKNLLDHFAYMFHRPALFGKKGMVVATSKGAGEKAVAKYLKTVLGQWGVNGAMTVTSNEKEKELQSSAKEAAKLDSAAERFYRLVKSEKQLPPSLRAIAVYNSFRAMSLSEFAESESDKRFWQRDGFRDRAYPAKAGPIKYAVGAILHGAAKNATKMVGRVYKKRQDQQE
ncbi:MAG: NAD(P)H-dependent oxidoreductase [Oscillospiraceae bacterium]|nr:NAD(P)H-dependent oxidoreductase [Oscillospiraceae bacterium]